MPCLSRNRAVRLTYCANPKLPIVHLVSSLEQEQTPKPARTLDTFFFGSASPLHQCVSMISRTRSISLIHPSPRSYLVHDQNKPTLRTTPPHTLISHHSPAHHTLDGSKHQRTKDQGSHSPSPTTLTQETQAHQEFFPYPSIAFMNVTIDTQEP